MDPHNARTVYHAIILRAMAELYRILPAEADIKPDLERAIRRADRTLVDEIRTRGATDADHTLSALVAVHRALGAEPQRSDAIRIVINAMVAQVAEKRVRGVDDLTLLAVGEALPLAIRTSRGMIPVRRNQSEPRR
jgi:hypothetical protein